jgi:hypothetical protein
LYNELGRVWLEEMLPYFTVPPARIQDSKKHSIRADNAVRKVEGSRQHDGYSDA